MTFRKENRPNRITDGTCFALVSDIRPDCFDMGSHPLFSFALWRRLGVLIRTLASRFQAKPGLLSGGVSCMQEPPVTGFNPPGFKKGLALPSGANKSGLHRIDHDAVRCVRIMTSRIWAPWGRNCGNRNLFSQHQKRAPETPRGQHETVIEILCEVGTIRSMCAKK
jgi:hypothetical protein